VHESAPGSDSLARPIPGPSVVASVVLAPVAGRRADRGGGIVAALMERHVAATHEHWAREGAAERETEEVDA
jgi:hypothetical protein